MTLDEMPLPHDASAEEALERAAQAWRSARARLESVDPAVLAPSQREQYFRLLARIGLWADARVGGDEPVALDGADEILPLVLDDTFHDAG
jgi:hypothetical protein